MSSMTRDEHLLPLRLRTYSRIEHDVDFPSRAFPEMPKTPYISPDQTNESENENEEHNMRNNLFDANRSSAIIICLVNSQTAFHAVCGAQPCHCSRRLRLHSIENLSLFEFDDEPKVGGKMYLLRKSIEKKIQHEKYQMSQQYFHLNCFENTYLEEEDDADDGE